MIEVEVNGLLTVSDLTNLGNFYSATATTVSVDTLAAGSVGCITS